MNYRHKANVRYLVKKVEITESHSSIYIAVKKCLHIKYLLFNQMDSQLGDQDMLQEDEDEDNVLGDADGFEMSDAADARSKRQIGDFPYDEGMNHRVLCFRDS